MQRRILLALLSCCIAVCATARHPVHIRKRYQHRGFPNLLTANLPSLVFATGCVGPGAGIEYERFVGKKAKWSVAVPLYFFSCTTFTMGVYHIDKIETEPQGGYVVPGFMYHPFRNTHHIDFSFGPALMLGNIHRRDREAGLAITHPELNFERSDNLIGAAARFNFTLHSPYAFVFGVHLDIGAIDAGPTRSEFIQFGIKLGARF